MKRIISLMLVIFALTVFVAGCGKRASQRNEKFSVVTTIFPEYDWVMNILGDKSDRFDVTMLLDNGVDLHSYQPTADDIIKISRCDLFVYVGGESDEWVNDALKEATNKNMQIINLLDVLGNAVKEEELKEGMETEDEDEETEEPEYDEHIWLSLKNAAVAVSEISKAIEKTDSVNTEVYKANTDSYVKKLNELDEKYANAVNKSKFKTVVFADRFPFRYLTDDYKIDYYAAFAGCSAESEASFETVKFLAEKVDSLGIGAVLTLEGTQHKIAQTVVSTAKNKSTRILTIDSMQSATSKDVDNGMTYVSVMEKNLKVLTEALN